MNAETTTKPGATPATHGNDAVCFTAGTEVAAFGAGTLHAYLAMNRPAPAIVAGISSGALAAAAMRKSFIELQKAQDAFGKGSPKAEAARWRWFRLYLERLCDRPFDVIWAALPNQSDFFADHPPINDPAITEAGLVDRQTKAQEQRYRLVQLGRWLIHLSVRVQDVADVAVAYVRYKERYGEVAWMRWVHLGAASMRLTLALLWHAATHPTWYKPASRPRGKLGGNRPLLGYPIWIATCLVLMAGVGALCMLAVYLASRLGRVTVPGLAWWVSGAAIVALPVVAAFLVSTLRVSRWTNDSVAQGTDSVGKRLSRAVLHAAGLDQAVLSDFHLRVALTELFDGERVPSTADSGPHPVLVAAPLQSIFRDGKPEVARQLYARPKTPVVDALLTAMALPGLFDPTDVNKEPGLCEQWLESGRDENKNLQLIDGAAIRQNPLPALFRYLRDHPALSARLASGPLPSALYPRRL